MTIYRFVIGALLVTAVAAILSPAQNSQQSGESLPAPAKQPPADHLLGDYGPYRANNDLLYYHLDIRVDPEKKFLSGKNSVRFKMLKDDSRIQLDLHSAFNVDKILLNNASLRYEREGRAVYVDFPQPLKAGQIYTIDFYYSGHPVETGRFGGFTFRKALPGVPG